MRLAHVRSFSECLVRPPVPRGAGQLYREPCIQHRIACAGRRRGAAVPPEPHPAGAQRAPVRDCHGILRAEVTWSSESVRSTQAYILMLRTILGIIGRGERI